MTDPLESVIRPIVEGQIRGFVKEHPSILTGVNWFKPGVDKSETLTGSIAKRVVRDLLCAQNRERIATAIFALLEKEKSGSGVAFCTAPEGAGGGIGSAASVEVERGTLNCADSGPAGSSAGWAAPILKAAHEGRRPPTIIVME